MSRCVDPVASIARLLVLPPDRDARAAILRLHLAGRPIANDVDLGDIANRTEGLSGADLAHVCQTATQASLGASARSGKIVPIGRHDLRRAASDVHASTRPWFDTAYNYTAFSNSGGEYDELLAYIRQHVRR